MSDVVVGAGQIGQALATVLGADLVDVEGPVGVYDVMHVAFPWSPAFEDAVRGHAARCRPNLIVIHSTVPVGTSRRLDAVHSPVTGKHPDLVRSLRTFTKFFGGPRAADAALPFMALGIGVELVDDQETTEAGKLWATLQFGWLVALEKESRRFCQAVGADHDIAYRRFNEMYDAGYEALGEPFRLPALRHVDGPIGGHCVMANATLTPTHLADELLRMNATW